MTHLRIAAACALAAAGTSLTACATNDTGTTTKGDGRLTVTSTADECRVSADSAPSGTLQFKVTNEGSEVTEFYLYGEDGLRIVGEVENIGPGLTRDLVVNATPGTYQAACKPGMTGKGLRSRFTVTDSGDGSKAADVSDQDVETASHQYSLYVEDQSRQLLAATREFVEAYKAGDDDRARFLYPRARVHWERIEPVAESFGDLDPRMDLREADLEEGQRWTGWHRLEKDLWRPKGFPALTAGQRATYADLLLADTTELDERVEELTFTVDQIGNGAKSLLDEVATGKVTGEEEAWSHTDLFDFQANVDGARVAFEGLRPVLTEKDPALERLTERRFEALQDLLDRYRTDDDGFVSYTTLSTGEVKALSDAVNALSEPLARLTAAVAL